MDENLERRNVSPAPPGPSDDRDSQPEGIEPRRESEELRTSNEALQQQAAELEMAAEQLHEQASELEAANEQLQLQAAELEATIEQLRATEEELEERTLAAEAASQRIRAILESIQEAFYALDREWRFTYANPQSEKLIGRRASDLLGRALWDVFPYLLGTPFEREFRAVMTTGRQSTFVAFGPRVGAWLELSVYPSADGGISVYFRDVSERVAYEAERARLVSILDATTDVVGIATPDGRLEYLNASGRRFYGIESDAQLAAFRLTDAYAGEAAMREYRDAPVAEALRDGTWSGEVYALAADGREVPMSRVVIAHKDESGALAYISGISRDLTAQKAAEAATAESERRYRIMFDRNPMPMWVVDVDTLGFLAVNDAAVEHYGWSREELSGMNLRDIRPPEERGKLPITREWHEGRQNVPGVQAHWTKDGRLLRVEVVFYALTWEGKRSRLVLLNDITQRLGAEAALRESEARLAGVVGSAMDAIVSVDHEQRIVVFNEAAERTFLIASSEALGMPLARFIPSLARASRGRGGRDTRQAWPTAESMGRLGELMALRADGSEFPIEATISHAMVGTERLSTIILRDVTDRRSLEAQLRQAQKMEAVGQLAGGVAHDFNNLLGAIIGYLDFVRPALAVGTEARADLEEVQAAADRATKLTRQLLAFSRRQVLQPDVVDLNEVVRGVWRLLQRVIGANIRLVQELSPEAGFVRADASQLDQVLLNVTVNARDAMPEGGTLRVRTRACAASDAELSPRLPRAAALAGTDEWWSMIIVEDSGVGMEADAVERAFEPFFTTKPSGKGTGLGLSTVYGIVQQSGGSVWIESAPGKGTRVTIALPRRTGAAAAPVAPPPPQERLPGNRQRVLLVEDDAALRTLTRRMLTSNGYEVVDASDGQEALARWSEQAPGEPFDAVITDVVMPDMGGRELVSRLRRMATSIRVLYVSGYLGDEVLDLDLSGATALVPKPFAGDALLAQLRTLMMRS